MPGPSIAGELRVTAGPAAGTTIPLEKSLLVGRGASGAGRLSGEPALSIRHAQVIARAGSILVIDLGSREGTWVNGERVMTRELALGDVVRFGATSLELVEGPARTSSARDAEAKARVLKSQFPIFERLLYLNAGMEGPIPARAIAAVDAQLEVEAARGRSGEHWGNLEVLCSRLREGYARVLGCGADEVALTRATTDGVNVVLGGLHFGPGDEILTTDEEHQGVYAPLGALRKRYGCRIRVAPFDQIASAVTSDTRLIACSHVSWLNGRVIDVAALKRTGVPLLLDGAQAFGAIPFNVHELGCDFYAASGQKWMCGPDRSGCLYVRADRVEDLSPPRTANYFALADASRPLDLVLAPGARRFDPGNLPGPTALWAHAALDILEEAGLDWVRERGPMLASRLAQRLRDAGVEVEARGSSTILSLRVANPAGVVEELEAAGIIVREVHGRIRVSVGAWCVEEDLDRFVESVTRITGEATPPPSTAMGATA